MTYTDDVTPESLRRVRATDLVWTVGGREGGPQGRSQGKGDESRWGWGWGACLSLRPEVTWVGEGCGRDREAWAECGWKDGTLEVWDRVAGEVSGTKAAV